ncbi:glycosyltransferase family 2 protein [Xanthobacter agilis]|uniref:GT2 family glycosyltransferase n=1 Tax=Xanthobacter agilis TaxID=47492 RepID=A0ABU0LHA5_XANAG|nr:glycosyltransferase family 2 protein [Xanthobacter agilis]MDQ0506504.1 GT2 family glycosyltransferase [Xanthobacter agilis]
MSATSLVATPRLTVVFVTYNSGAVIARAVASVPDDCAVIIVDNASPEGTPWRESLSRPADVVPMGRNAGFGTACNAGARRAQTPYVMFLNPDAVLAGDAVDALFAAARAYGDDAILMPAIMGEDGRRMRKEGTIFDKVPRRARLNAQEIAGDYCTGFVHGAAFMVKRDAFLALGGFDEAIFLYHEDDDLSLRARARNMPIVVVTGARAVHAGGGSSTPSFAQTFAINRFKQQSERYVRDKYRRERSRTATALKLLAGCLLAGLLLDPHRVAVRAGKLRGLFDALPAPTGR